MSIDVRLSVWYDGDCELCRRSRAWCEERSPTARLRFIDIRNLADDRLPVPRHDLESSMWVQTGDGELVSGFEGWQRILDAMPRWRWLSRICGVPPLAWIGSPLYRLVAHWRNRLPVGRSLAP